MTKYSFNLVLVNSDGMTELLIYYVNMTLLSIVCSMHIYMEINHNEYATDIMEWQNITYDIRAKTVIK